MNPIAGYDYGRDTISKSSISLQELEQLKISVGFTAEDERYLRMAGHVLEDQAKHVVERWRSGIIVNIPHLARHSRSPEGNPLVDKMHRAWCKSLQLQIALWTGLYAKMTSNEW